jgi:hypothetical protein
MGDLCMPTLRVKSYLDAECIEWLKDDPVRPDILAAARVGPHAEIIAIGDEDRTDAVVCVKYCTDVPTTVDELLQDPGSNNVAVFYTIWSYKAGAGAKLIFVARDHILNTRPEVTRFVTLSPTTELAKRFHLKNGANIFRTNKDTVNYEYSQN